MTTSALSALNSFLYPHGSIFGTRNYEVYRDGDNVLIEVDLPGLSPDDVEVTVEGNSLSIVAQKETERRRTSFRKVFNIDGFDGKSVKPVIAHGVLTISLSPATSKKSTKVKVLAA